MSPSAETPVAVAYPTEDPYRFDLPPLMGFLRGLGLLRGIFREPQVGPRPDLPLELYSMEGCPACRKVRRVLTELDLDFVHRSCPRGASPKRRYLERRGGKLQVPYLIDPNTGIELYESADIVAHLRACYGPEARRELEPATGEA